MDQHPDHPTCDQADGDPACYDKDGVLIVDVRKLAEVPAPDPAHARPSSDSPGMPGGTAGTGGEHTSQDN
jgi:hypothetical protein